MYIYINSKPKDGIIWVCPWQNNRERPKEKAGHGKGKFSVDNVKDMSQDPIT